MKTKKFILNGGSMLKKIKFTNAAIFKIRRVIRDDFVKQPSIDPVEFTSNNWARVQNTLKELNKDLLKPMFYISFHPLINK